MSAGLGLLIVRIVVGALFVGHGVQKLLGWFGGHGLAGTAQWIESLGLRPGRIWAMLAGTLEILGGLFFGLGLFNPLGTILICAVMVMAIARVHGSRGPWVTNGGYEYPLTIIALTAAVALAGPGRYALDPYIGVALPIVPLLVAGLLAALGMVAVTGWSRPAMSTEIRRAA